MERKQSKLSTKSSRAPLHSFPHRAIRLHFLPPHWGVRTGTLKARKKSDPQPGSLALPQERPSWSRGYLREETAFSQTEI